MPPREETIELVRAAQRGEQEAFADLFAEYHQPVLGYVYHTVHNKAAAEDITQDAFIRAHQSLPGLGPPYDFKSWVFRIAGNLAIDYLRAGKRFVDADDDVLDLMHEEPTGRRPHERRLDRKENTRLIWGSLDQMPAHYRQALIMKEFSELSYGEMASAMEVSYDNARQLVHRARTMFREIHGLRAAVERAAERCGVLGALLSAYQDGELPAHQVQPVQDHLAECQDCIAEQDELKRVGAILAGLAPLPATPAWRAETLDKLRAQKPTPAATAAQVGPTPGPAPAPTDPAVAAAGASGGAGHGFGWLFALASGGVALVLLLAVVVIQVGASLGLLGGGGDGPAGAPPVPSSAVAGQPSGADSPTETDKPTPAPSLTATPSVTVTATPTLAPPRVKATENSNCRAGPSNQYIVMAVLLTGESALVSGKNAAETWWWIESPGGSGHCYVWDGLVEKSGDFSQVPVVPDPPTPTPDSPPTVSISHSPTGSNRPRSNETVTFNATASDDIAVNSLEIWVDSPAAGGFSMVQSCSGATTCSYTGGPYPAGQLSYYARTTDSGGNSTTSNTTTITIFGPAQ